MSLVSPLDVGHGLGSTPLAMTCEVPDHSTHGRSMAILILTRATLTCLPINRSPKMLHHATYAWQPAHVYCSKRTISQKKKFQTMDTLHTPTNMCTHCDGFFLHFTSPTQLLAHCLTLRWILQYSPQTKIYLEYAQKKLRRKFYPNLEEKEIFFPKFWKILVPPCFFFYSLSRIMLCFRLCHFSFASCILSNSNKK